MPDILDFNDEKKHHVCFCKKTAALAGSCGMLTYNIARLDGQACNKKLQLMWITSPSHDTDVNWFAVGFGDETASQRLYMRFVEQNELKDFNRSPSINDESVAKITTYDFDLGIKATVSMTSYPRAQLKVKI